MKRLDTDLLSRLATDYVGERVTVIWERLPGRTMGLAWRSASGDAFVSLGYGYFDSRELLLTFLHECRHLVRGDVTASRHATRPPERIAADYRTGGREDTAQRFEAWHDAMEADCDAWAEAELPRLLRTGILAALWID